MSNSEHKFQKTLTAEVKFQGAGLHTGGFHKITVYPSEVNTGIVFRRIDAKGQNTEMRANWKNTKELPLCTCLVAKNGLHVRTVEHLLAAFYACGITNALIEVDGSEIPLLDGSALSFVTALEKVGIQEQSEPKKYLRILKTIEVSEEGNRWLKIEPAERFSADLSIRLAKIGHLQWQGDLDTDTVKQHIIAARTFGRLRNGILAKIVSLFKQDPICLGVGWNSSAIIVGDKAINGLRMPDEYICHRVLDLIGDMMLAETHILGKITGFSTAHRLNQRLLAALFADESAWCWET